MELVNPSIEQLVTEIIAVNHAWKEAKDLFEETASPLANALRDLKTRLQIRLLRNYAPEWVFLIEDNQTEGDEPLYGLQLVKAIGSWRDAAHIPIRVAQENLSLQELKIFVKY